MATSGKGPGHATKVAASRLLSTGSSQAGQSTHEEDKWYGVALLERKMGRRLC